MQEKPTLTVGIAQQAISTPLKLLIMNQKQRNWV